MDDAVSMLVARLSLDDLAASTIATANTLMRKCQAQHILPNDRALAAVALQVAMEIANHPTTVQDQLLRISTVDKSTYLRAVKQVRAESNSLAATKSSPAASARFSIGSLCVRFSVNSICKSAERLLDSVCKNQRLQRDKMNPEWIAAAFYVCAKANGMKNITTSQLISLGALSKPYFLGAIQTIETYSKNNPPKTPTSTAAARETIPLTPKAVSSRSPTVRMTPAQRAAMVAQAAAAAVEHVKSGTVSDDDDDDDESHLLMVPNVALSTSAKKIVAHGETTPVARKIARGGFRSSSKAVVGTPSKGSAKGTLKRSREEVASDDEGNGILESGNGRTLIDGGEKSVWFQPSSGEVQHKRNPFIGRQSMINWEDDSGTSKKMRRAQKWLDETRLLLDEKIAEKLEQEACVMRC
ncbi:hypothetical protein BJ741DRAFT_612842 [Chytriomyces cf. hyalinus JEL632]|nr:hypothetical protein BJ741DRAFT_612842 [Chytriomyces cf. hyalinus JEL632]